MARVLLGCYRTGEANDPEVYSAAVISVISGYPLSIVRRVVDPRFGLPSKSKWLPTIAELKAALEDEMGPIRREEARRSIPQLEPPIDRSNRPTYEELQAQCWEVGLKIGQSRRGLERLSAHDFCQKFNISREQFDAIPDAK